MTQFRRRYFTTTPIMRRIGNLTTAEEGGSAEENFNYKVEETTG